jgi:DNA mismatch repair protein MutS2
MDGSASLVDRKTLADLGFNDIVAAVGEKTTFGKARRLVMAMEPPSDPRERRRLSALVAEVDLLSSEMDGDAGSFSVDLGHVEDPVPLLDRLDKGGILSGQEILLVEKIIPPYLALGRLCRKSGGRIPGLKRLVSDVSDDPDAAGSLGEISLEIAAVLEEDGSVKDGATAELKQLRSRLRSLRKDLAGTLKALMEGLGRFLQDDYYTIRDGRYVLPIKSEDRVHVKGIIHGYSQSGATVFIEPESIVDDCNRLKITEEEIRAEEEKVLRHLSGLMADQAPVLRRLEAFLAFFDYLGAIVRFGRSIGGSLARLVDEPVLDLRDARHPLLLIGGSEVIPNSVRLESGQGWIISGPNAGGKTILLKTAGLCLLMAYCGIPVPAGAGSTVGSFDVIRSVIGDDQSVARNLSTFSAQVQHLTDILECAGSRSLVLLDELATGTEPQEGAALAREILLELVVEKGAGVMAATHFESLKMLSVSHRSFVAAGMGFDFESLSPNFRLTMGVPGISGGLMVASRYGLPRRIIDRARAFLEGGGEQLSARLEEIEKMKNDLEREIAGLAKKKTELRSREKEIQGIKDKLVDRKRKELTAQEAYLTTELRLLHGELKEAHKLLRRRPVSGAAVKSTARTAEKVSRLLAPEGRLTRLVRPRGETGTVPPEKLRPGETVLISKLGLHGVIEALEGKKVRVTCEGRSLIVSRNEIFLEKEEASMTTTKDKDEAAPEPAGDQGTEMDQYQNPYNTLDVRGKALDEALIEIDAFVDHVAEMGLHAFYIVHGHGTGVLKTGIRRHLRHLKYVESFKPGGRNEGGDGCTVVKIKDLGQ